MTISNLPRGVYVTGQGPAVVLLHSSLSSARQWQYLVSLLKADFTVINFDMLGYGKAEKVDDGDNYDLNVETARINQVLQQVIGEAPYHLVGHSCGGAIALKLSVEAPEKLLSLALFEPVAFHLLPRGSEQRQQADDFKNQVFIDDAYLAAEIFTNFWNKPGFFKSLPKKMQDLMAADIAKVNLDFKGLIAESYTLADLSGITCRALFMHGNESPGLSRHLGQIISQALPQVSEQAFDAGHMGPVSHSEQIHPVIADFIRAG
ncbi:alpha/beta fold hydrolase [Thalassomonas viridans]|uniref:Alpha/beta fold hydrolase n=1 Tax=Thalassomonas viridans TaxID=137584 RepID=A0AAE9Z7R0_9GAMM|nr:alpha/beta hydrolase [Thalassomonas viridans]WDE06848.1 alpha/beta fold hydrolase [Thalassomonas viridans]